MKFTSARTAQAFKSCVLKNFSSRAKTYDDDETGSLHKRWIRTLLERYPPVLPALDVACGTGWLSTCDGSKGAGWTNLDVTPEMIQVAKGRAPEATCVVGSADELGVVLPGERFGSVYCCCAVMYFSDVGAFLREVSRVLVPGGFLAVQVFTEDSFVAPVALERACERLFGEGQLLFRNPNSVTADRRTVEKLFIDQGYENVEVRG